MCFCRCLRNKILQYLIYRIKNIIYLTSNFLYKQFIDIKKGGPLIFINKLKAFFNISLLTLSLPIVLLLFLVKKWKNIKFFRIDCSRIGHQSGFIFGYLFYKKNFNQSNKQSDIIFLSKKTCNKFIDIIAKRKINARKYNFILNYIERSLKWWNCSNHILSHDELHAAGRNIGYQYRGVLISKIFNNSELEQGKKILKNLKIENEKDWICIHNRDDSYLKKTYKNQNWDYHSHRDFNINSMAPAIKHFIEKGYYVVRMGSEAKEQLKIKNEKLIDYSFSKFKSDFADVFLLANCKFYFGSNSGVQLIPYCFGKPDYTINFIPTLISDLFNYYKLPFITKHLYDTELQRNLSLREMFEKKLNNKSRADDFLKSNIKLISNTEEEIKEFASEVVSNLKNEINDEDKYLQKEFWNIFFKHCPQNNLGTTNPKIGASFLRKNKYLLN